MLKPFDIEPRKDILKKSFVSEEENSCEEEINLTPQDRTDNIDWCKCEGECKKMVISAETFFLLLCLKPRSARGASRYSAFMGNYPTISHTY